MSQCGPWGLVWSSSLPWHRESPNRSTKQEERKGKCEDRVWDSSLNVLPNNCPDSSAADCLVSLGDIAPHWSFCHSQTFPSGWLDLHSTSSKDNFPLSAVFACFPVSLFSTDLPNSWGQWSHVCAHDSSASGCHPLPNLSSELEFCLHCLPKFPSGYISSVRVAMCKIEPVSLPSLLFCSRHQCQPPKLRPWHLPLFFHSQILVFASFLHNSLCPSHCPR